MTKNPIFKDAIDFARIGDEARRALKTKKNNNGRKYHRKMRRRMLRG